jgi:hypothetical protein
MISSTGMRMLEQAEPASKTRRLPETLTLGWAGLTLLSASAVNAVWSIVGPDLVAVFSALVQTGITTRLVLLGLFFAGGFSVFALRTWKQVWYGHLACVVGLVIAWNMIANLAIEIQGASVVALVAAGFILVRGLVNIQEGRERESQVLP